MTAIAYETVQLADGSLPLLSPMSEVAGRLGDRRWARTICCKPARRRGMLLGGVPGAPKANVVIIGGGVAGEHAAANAIGLGADVTVVDISLPRLRELEARFGGAIDPRLDPARHRARRVDGADLVIGAVLVPGRRGAEARDR